MTGGFELSEHADSFQAIWDGDKHHVMFFDAVRGGEVKWLKVGVTLYIRDMESTTRHIQVQVTHVEKVRNELYALSFHHIHRNGTRCCRAAEDRAKS